MCGISGIFGELKSTDFENAKKMVSVLKHRGPDAEGIWNSDLGEVILGHNRLAIIDLNESSNQPFHSHNNKYVMVYNGELYNYLELRSQCEKKGCKFKTNSDTEVFLTCFDIYGEKAFDKFDGMFAAVIYDRSTQKITLVRDPFGIKPLFWGIIEGKFYFASEIKALLVANSKFKEFDPITSALFLTTNQYEKGNWTFYKHIKKFPHRHFATIHVQNIVPPIPQEYWAPSSETFKGSFNDAVDTTRALLENSVKMHLVSDVEVGSCLSGGLDSSAIVSIASKNYPRTLSTFTTHFPEFPEFDETRWANLVSNHCSASPHHITPNFHEFKSDFDRLLYHQDEPFSSLSIYSQYKVFKDISNTNCKVILDGQGPDEALAGYHGGFTQYLIYELLGGNFMNFFREFRAIKSLHNAFKLSQITRSILGFTRRRLVQGRSPLINNKYDFDKLTDSLEKRIKYIFQIPQSYEDSLRHQVLDGNIPALLRFEDRNSMAFSIESRVPFLQKDLMNHWLNLPLKYRIQNGVTKRVLREASRPFLPNSIIDRIDKLGFAGPDQPWCNKLGVKANGPGSYEWKKFILDKWSNNNFIGQ
jgi:asparagine synthase (glutamine-hydrolysing)